MFRWVFVVGLVAVATGVRADPIEDKAALCNECHGDNGQPQYPTAPIIWGQNAGYLYLQMRDFQKGARKDDRMTPVAQGLVKQDALELAEYFAAKPWPNLDQPAASKSDAALAMTAINSVVCGSCHGSEFLGDSSIPRVAGQSRDYLLKTMTDFRTRFRANNPGMSDLIHTVTPEQLGAMAAYLAGL